MANLTDFTPSASAGGGGLKPKFQEFNGSGTFYPSQALIDAGGYIEVFVVGGGAGSSYIDAGGGSGGEVLIKTMYLSNTNGCSVGVGSGGGTNTNGGSSYFYGASAGGYNVTAKGGTAATNSYTGFQNYSSPSWGGGIYGDNASAGNGVFGYGAGGAGYFPYGGVRVAKANTGQGGTYNQSGASGYVKVTWYE